MSRQTPAVEAAYAALVSAQAAPARVFSDVIRVDEQIAYPVRVFEDPRLPAPILALSHDPSDKSRAPLDVGLDGQTGEITGREYLVVLIRPSTRRETGKSFDRATARTVVALRPDSGPNLFETTTASEVYAQL